MVFFSLKYNKNYYYVNNPEIRITSLNNAQVMLFVYSINIFS